MTATLVLLAVIAGAAAASTACGVNMVVSIRSAIDDVPKHRVIIPYVAGSVLGATLVGIILAQIGRLLASPQSSGQWSDVAVIVLLFAAVLLGLREVGFIRLPLPQRANQLNQDGMALGASRRFFWFGAWLGVAFLTFSPYAGLHLVALAAVLAPSTEVSVALFVAFGLARGAVVAAAGAASGSWGSAATAGDWIASNSAAAQRATAAGLAVVATTALVWLLQ